MNVSVCGSYGCSCKKKREENKKDDQIFGEVYEKERIVSEMQTKQRLCFQKSRETKKKYLQKMRERNHRKKGLNYLGHNFNKKNTVKAYVAEVKKKRKQTCKTSMKIK